MMIEIKAPNYPEPLLELFLPSVFLAGSIEMGNAVNWQKEVINVLQHTDCLVYNPRRDDWDSSWVQSIKNKEFSEQVEWELAHLNSADIIFMYFAPDTKSPISLLEYGMFCRQDNMIVCCPEGFWRKGNIEVTSDFYGTQHNLHGNLDDAIIGLMNKLKTV